MFLKKLLIIFIILLSSTGLYAKPLAGVAVIDARGVRAQAIADITEKHLLAILDKTELFSTINYGIIKRELKKFQCTSESCILNFARKADIDLIITGEIHDSKNHITIDLRAFAMGIPHQGKLIARRKTKILLRYCLTSREFSLISEEQAGKFAALILQKLKTPANITNGKVNCNPPISGEYQAYSANGDKIQNVGVVRINNNQLEKPLPAEKKHFILLRHLKESKKLSDYYIEEKKRIVFHKPSLSDTFSFVLFTVPASMTMPLASPILGYAPQNDWSGLGLWTVNASPWLYVEARGFIERPSKLHSRKEDISRDDIAMNQFAWYMFVTGGSSLFVDSFSRDYLNRASYFKRKYELMGNPWTAAWLSLVSNGGGHFYRGNRLWGYFYFHLNNSLLYLTLRSHARPKSYDRINDRYISKKRNDRMFKIYGSTLVLSKTLEIIHTIMSQDRIGCGEELEESFGFAPIVLPDERGNLLYGMNFVYRY